MEELFQITDQEREQILKNAFASFEPLKLKVFPAKEKRKFVVLMKIVEQFQPERRYAEKEINEILKGIYEDFALIRRYLIDYHLLERTKDGREYWRK